MRARSLIVAICAFGAVASGAPAASACDQVVPPLEQRAAAWPGYLAEADRVVIGRVVAMRPYTRAERLALEPSHIAGARQGDRLGWADIAPMEILHGPRDPLTIRYSNGRVCDMDLWYPAVGDAVLVVEGRGGLQLFGADDIPEPVLRDHFLTYETRPSPTGQRE